MPEELSIPLHSPRGQISSHQLFNNVCVPRAGRQIADEDGMGQGEKRHPSCGFLRACPRPRAIFCIATAVTKYIASACGTMLVEGIISEANKALEIEIATS